MKEMTNLVFNACIRTPFSLILAGPSSSGKTSLTLDLIENEFGIIDNKFDYIIWCYGETIPQKDKIKHDDKIHFLEGLPTDFDSFINPELNGLVIFDDLMAECSNSKIMSDFFTKKSHHQNVSVIFITQNLFHSGSERKTMTRNATYLIVFNSPLDQKIPYYLANQLTPRNQKTFLDIYNYAANKPYGYLFIDGHQQTNPATKYRTNITKQIIDIFTPKSNFYK